MITNTCYGRLQKTLEIQRFLLLLKENNVPRLPELVSVAMHAGRSIGYITDKLTDAINDIYCANSSEDDKDIAFFIQQLGGPALLDMVARAIRLPSNSTIYRMLKGTSTINSSFLATPEEIVQNIKFNDDAPKYSYICLKLTRLM